MQPETQALVMNFSGLVIMPLTQSDVNRPITDERCLVLIDKTYFESWKNAAGYHPGPVTPSTADWAASLSLNNFSKVNFSVSSQHDADQVVVNVEILTKDLERSFFSRKRFRWKGKSVTLIEATAGDATFFVFRSHPPKKSSRPRKANLSPANTHLNP